MYTSNDFYTDNDGHFALILPKDKPFRILQLTDLHLGFGALSYKADAMCMDAVSKVIDKAKADLIILTGDSIFPFLPKAGTLNNLKEARKLVSFMDSFKVPYALIFGNHDIEMGARGSKEQVAQIFAQGKYSIFANEDDNIYGFGNYIIKLLDENGGIVSALVMLDSNMYGDGWFFSGFDCIHQDQINWCMDSLQELKKQNENLKAMSFFHMPIAEYKIAYEKMKLKDKSVIYNFGSIGEKNDYFGISKNECDFFAQAEKSGIIKAMFCGHDHLNTLSLTYHGIVLTYGMSMDCLGYKGIRTQYTQRGGTLVDIDLNGDFNISPLPLTTVVSTRVRGKTK